MPRSSRSGLPTRCLEDHPNSKSIRLSGRFINMAEIERTFELDHGYVSYILQGKRTPSISYAKRLAKALGMFDEEGQPDVNGLMKAIAERVADMDEDYKRRLA